MGYDIHITRAEHWAENEGREISAEEWLAYVQKDPELKIDEANSEHFAIWSGDVGEPLAWFEWSAGDVATKNPDEATIEKAVSIARHFNAKVQGDDGEVYPGGGQEPYYA
jgi:hypothetical protein